MPLPKKLELLRTFLHNASTCCPAAKPTQNRAMQDTDHPEQLLGSEGLDAAAQKTKDRRALLRGSGGEGGIFHR